MHPDTEGHRIDEFAVSKAYREVSQTSYPERKKTDGSQASPLKLVGVTKMYSGNSPSWQIKMTSTEDCAVLSFLLCYVYLLVF